MLTEVVGESLTKAAEVGSRIVESASKAVETAAELSEQTSEVAGEAVDVSLNEVRNAGDVILEPELDQIKEQSLTSLIARNNELPSSLVTNQELSEEDGLPELENKSDQTLKEAIENVEDPTVKEGLTVEQKAQIIKETGWPPEIVENIGSMEQYEIYKDANLKFTEINGRPCLVKDIDMNYVSPSTIDINNPEGLTNRQLLEKGRAPYDAKTNEAIELHHIGQDYNSPFAELCENSEHGDGNDSTLHPKRIESWRQNLSLKNRYNNIDRPRHWKARV